jgi:hypothetical protein
MAYLKQGEKVEMYHVPSIAMANGLPGYLLTPLVRITHHHHLSYDAIPHPLKKSAAALSRSFASWVSAFVANICWDSA